MTASIDPCAIEGWHSKSEYQHTGLQMTSSKFYEITNLLLERPNLNSTHLFRADIMLDSAGLLKTVAEKEIEYVHHDGRAESSMAISDMSKVEFNGISRTDLLPNASDNTGTIAADKNEQIALESFEIPGFHLTRTILRKLIPRKPQVDRSLEQTCFVYVADDTSAPHPSIIVVYAPHAKSEDEMPWYHPQVRALAYRYDHDGQVGTLSVHYKPYSESTDLIPSRLHRTFLSLLQTFVRLCRLDTPAVMPSSEATVQASARLVTPAALKDTILPQHIVQDTYTRLKQTYASHLISKWVETTDPTKHVFEDLAVAAFMIELWKTMYQKDSFPGFVDIACGNGVLVYILIKEGFDGHGFDARRRKTWDILGIDNHLDEMLCIPKPFLDVLTTEELDDALRGTKIHNGAFGQGRFIISNHADELTPWTPILAALSCIENHLPFLSIPCCSHALSGGKHRYTFKDIDAGQSDIRDRNATTEDDQPAKGDLKALKAQKTKALSHGDDNSMYACLTKKTVALAEEIGFKTEMTLMRIPSTRSIGIVGNRHRTGTFDTENTTQRISDLLARECSATGGLRASALAWIERGRKHIGPQGRGKVNLGKSSLPAVLTHGD